jgi:type VI secretion system protein ImpH
LLRGLIGQAGTKQPDDQITISSNLDLAGLTANRRLSLPVVQQMLKIILGLTLIKMTSLQGGWLDIDSQDHAYLGQGSGCRLGSTAVLGRRVWDQQKAIELLIGPISWSQLYTFIPGGQNHNQLVMLLKRITDGRCDCKVSFECPRKQVPLAYLNSRQVNESSTVNTGFFLGLTSFLNSKKTKKVEENTMTTIRFTVNTAQ